MIEEHQKSWEEGQDGWKVRRNRKTTEPTGKNGIQPACLDAPQQGGKAKIKYENMKRNHSTLPQEKLMAFWSLQYHSFWTLKLVLVLVQPTAPPVARSGEGLQFSTPWVSWVVIHTVWKGNLSFRTELPFDSDYKQELLGAQEQPATTRVRKKIGRKGRPDVNIPRISGLVDTGKRVVDSLALGS